MSGEDSTSNGDVAMAMCGGCDAFIPADSASCPECNVSFTGVQEVDRGECGACHAIIPLESKTCPSCGAQFTLDDLIQTVSNWMNEEGMTASSLFGAWDANGDGVLSGLEIRNGLRGAGLAVLPRQEIERFLHQIDLNNDQMISLEELSTALSVSLGGDEDPRDTETIDETDADATEDESATSEDGDGAEDEDSIPQEKSDDDAREGDGDDEVRPDEDEDENQIDEDDDSATDSDDDAGDADGEEQESDEKESLLNALHHLITDNNQNLSNLFTEADEDFDGKVTLDELKSVVSENFSEDYSVEEVSELFLAIDTDEDGAIDLIEMVAAVEDPDEVEERIRKKEREKPTSFDVFMMSNEENIFPIIWSLVVMFTATVVINVYGFFSNLFECVAGDDEWLQRYCEESTKLNLLDIFSSSDPASWSPTGVWGKPDYIAVVLLLGLLVVSIWYRSRVKSMKETFRKKKKSDDSDESTRAEEPDEEGSEEDEEESQDSDEEADEDDDADDEESGSEGDDDDEDGESSEEEDEDSDDDDEEEIDIGSHVGVEADGEEWYGVIVEFDEDDDEVLVKDDESGEEYWVPFDTMFVD